MSYKLSAFIAISVFLPVCKANCQYKDKWEENIYQVPTEEFPISRVTVGLTLFECLAKCFVHTQICLSLNYWTNTTHCEFFAGPDEDDQADRKGSSDVIHSFMPPDMKDVVGGCSEMEYPCFLDRFNLPRAEVKAKEDDEEEDNTSM